MTINHKPYHVLDVDGEELFQGNHQECLKYEIEQNNIELVTLPINDGEEVYELEEDHFNYTYED